MILTLYARSVRSNLNYMKIKNSIHTSDLQSFEAKLCAVAVNV